MKYQRCKLLLSLLPICLLITSCANNSSGPQSSSQSFNQVTGNNVGEVIQHRVQAGDHLSDIALKYTGLSSNWRDIAIHNKLRNPNKLQTGQVLAIPTKLIPGYRQAKQDFKPQPRPVPVKHAEKQRPKPTTPPTTSLAVRSNQLANVAPVVVTPISKVPDFELNPIGSKPGNQARTYAGKGTQVKVVGSYYPKGIYTGPAYHSKLILRVTPGAEFTLVSQVNDWYKIETSNGIGYIRTNDAAIVK